MHLLLYCTPTRCAGRDIRGPLDTVRYLSQHTHTCTSPLPRYLVTTITFTVMESFLYALVDVQHPTGARK